MVPFPWTTATAASKSDDSQGTTKPCPVAQDYQTLPDSKVDLAAASTSITSMYDNKPDGSDNPILYNLPADGCSAGKVLQHAVRAMEKLFRKHEPMIWKVGYTHNAEFRWSNDLYGYATSRDKWSCMVVLFKTNEPFSPAMLEAALIDKFGRSMPVFS